MRRCVKKNTSAAARAQGFTVSARIPPLQSGCVISTGAGAQDNSKSQNPLAFFVGHQQYLFITVALVSNKLKPLEGKNEGNTTWDA